MFMHTLTNLPQTCFKLAPFCILMILMWSSSFTHTIKFLALFMKIPLPICVKFFAEKKNSLNTRLTNTLV